MPQSALPDEGVWTIDQPEVSALMRKIEGTAEDTKMLKKYVDGKMYRGVLTGYNKAFVIDDTKRRELIADDPKNAEVIKPFLRGRDIMRYAIRDSGVFLIFIPWHFPLHKRDDISGASEEAEKAFMSQYPAVYNHLLQYKDSLSKRNAAETGIRYEWYASQRCAANYWQEFEKSKIVSARFMIEPLFGYDTTGAYTNDACYIIPTNDFYLYGIINSKLAWFYLSQMCCTVQNNYSQIHIQFLSLLPIRLPNDTQCKAIGEKVRQVLEAKRQGKDTTGHEREIDQLVYQIYGLTNEEIRTLEESIAR